MPTVLPHMRDFFFFFFLFLAFVSFDVCPSRRKAPTGYDGAKFHWHFNGREKKPLERNQYLAQRRAVCLSHSDMGHNLESSKGHWPIVEH